MKSSAERKIWGVLQKPTRNDMRSSGCGGGRALEECRILPQIIFPSNGTFGRTGFFIKLQFFPPVWRPVCFFMLLAMSPFANSARARVWLASGRVGRKARCYVSLEGSGADAVLKFKSW